MIRSRHVNGEIKNFEEIAKIKETDSEELLVAKTTLKAITLLTKLVRDVRVNQVIDLTQKYGKDVLVKSDERRTEDTA